MDIRTLLFAGLVMQVCCATGLLLMSSSVPGLKGLRWFAWAYGCATLGLLLLVSRGTAVVAPSQILARGLLVLGALLMNGGVADFVERGAPPAAWGWLLFASSVAVDAYFTLVAHSLAGSALCFCVAFAGQLSLGSVPLLRHRVPGERTPCRVIAALLIGIAGLSFLRVAAIGLGMAPVDILAFNPFRVAGIVAYMVFTLGMAFGFVWMITERLRIQLENLARTDALTGVLNRRALELAAESEIAACGRRGMPVSVLAIDLDHFKRMNDAFGHAAGDAALCAVAQQLLAGLRRADLVARFGGEEFVVVLPEKDSAAALEVAERLRRQVAEMRIDFEGVRLNLTASFGVATLEGHGAKSGDTASWTALLRRADHALYAAKQAGRNCTVVDAAMPEERVIPTGALLMASVREPTSLFG